MGQDVNFAVSATGMPSLIYHWYFWPSHGKPMLDWIPLTEVEGCEINIDAMRLEDVGIYKCFIEHRLQVFRMFLEPNLYGFDPGLEAGSK